jgi:hypothetical protein
MKRKAGSTYQSPFTCLLRNVGQGDELDEVRVAVRRVQPNDGQLRLRRAFHPGSHPWREMRVQQLEAHVRIEPGHRRE